MNKAVDQYNNTYHHSLSKKPINIDYLAWTEKIETNTKTLIPKRKIDWEFLNIRIFLVKVVIKIGQEKFLLPILFWKLILQLIKLKI